MFSSPFLRLLPLAVLLVLAGCTTTGASSSRVAGDTLTQEHLEEYNDQSAYDVIQRLKPTWLRRRGGSPEVVVDGQHRGGTNVLRQLAVQEIDQIHYLSPGDATMRYGTGFPYGAIQVQTKR